MKRAIFVVAIVMLSSSLVPAEIIRGINMEFVTIGNAGNAADSTGFGAVGYEYSIGKYEVTNGQWNAFTSQIGAPYGNPSNAYDQNATSFNAAQKPTHMTSWFEALQFCNYLTSGDKSKGAYQFSGTSGNAGDFLGIDREFALSEYGIAYVLPTENEWYKAAYYTGSGYSTYANGLDTIPAADNGWNYPGGGYSSPWEVGLGAIEQNGTFDMMGNVMEWTENLLGGNHRVVRGGSYQHSLLASNERTGWYQTYEDNYVGFRIAFIEPVPEPATLLLLGLGGMLIRKKK